MRKNTFHRTCVQEDGKLDCQMSGPEAKYRPDDDHVSDHNNESRGLILDTRTKQHRLFGLNTALFQVRSQE